MALLKTVANSTPTLAIAYDSNSAGMTLGSPGFPNHIRPDPSTSRQPNPAIHGLRRPLASAIAPRTGDISAIIRPAAAVANPHSACPLAGSGATKPAK